MLYRRLFLAFMVSLLAACGGGGDPPTPFVVPAPVITSQPASQAVTAGQPATFSVGVQDATGVSYQWLRNGTDIAGAAGASYTLPLAQLGDSGSTWSVRVGNSGGTVTSNAATLTVTPAIVQVPLGVSLFAGNLSSPAGNTDGVGAGAHFYGASGIAVDAAGNAYVVDSFNATLRKVSPAGVVTTLAGAAQAQGTVDGTGSNARFDRPAGLTLHSDGYLYLVDAGRVRRISLDGVVTTVPNIGLTSVGAIASGKDGLLYVGSGYAIYKFTPGGSAVLVAGSVGATGYQDGAGANARFGTPYGMAVDAQSFVYVGDAGNNVVRKISPGGEVTTLAGVVGGFGFADGIGAAARFRSPMNPVLDASGNVWVSDFYVLRRITPAGSVTTPFGGGQTENSKKGFTALAFDPSGNLLFTAGDGVGRIDAAGKVANVAGDLVTPDAAPAPVTGVRSLSVDAQGVVYAFGTTTKYLPSGQPVARALLPGELPAVFGPVPSTSSAVVIEPGGSFLVAVGSFNLVGLNVVAPAGGSIVRVTPAGVATVLGAWPGTGGVPYTPGSIAVDAVGIVYFTDFSGSALRKLALDGTVTTIGPAPMAYDFVSTNAARLAISPSGTLYMVGGNAIRKLDGQGNLVVVAGSPGNPDIVDGAGSAARFYGVGAPAFDAAGNLYVADRNTVRKVTPDGVVTTLAGQVKARGNTTGPLPASFGAINSLAVGPDGLLYVGADNALLRIKLQ